MALKKFDDLRFQRSQHENFDEGKTKTWSGWRLQSKHLDKTNESNFKAFFKETISAMCDKLWSSYFLIFQLTPNSMTTKFSLTQEENTNFEA